MPPRTRRRAIVVASLALTSLGVLAASTFLPAPLPAPSAFTGALPPASPPAEMSIARLPTGVTHRSAAFAYRGGSPFEARDFSMAALLIRHPRGDLLLDAGFGRDIDDDVARMPLFFRAATTYTAAEAAVDQLAAHGYDPAQLRAILLTHAHWDHTSGLSDFPGTPVWVSAAEHRFVAEGGFLTAVARSASATYEEYVFEGGSYLGFPSSHDVWGDGSIVVVPAPGHTPGSVIVFVALPTGTRYAFLGDLVWQREGITEREERPWLQRTLGDDDPALVREQIGRVAALSARFPEIRIVPAHDARAMDEIPAL